MAMSPAANPEPVIVRVMARLPTVAEEGEREVIAGPEVTVKVSALETRFPGLVTVTDSAPGWAITDAGTVTAI